MLLFVENPNNYIYKTLLELINEFTEVEGYKNSIQKSVADFTLTTMYLKNVASWLTLASIKIKYLGITQWKK